MGRGSLGAHRIIYCQKWVTCGGKSWYLIPHRDLGVLTQVQFLSVGIVLR